MKTRLKKISYILIFETLVTRIALFMSVPYLAIYLTTVLQFSSVKASYIIGCYPFATVMTSLLSKKLTKKITHKQVWVLIPFVWGLALIGSSFLTDFSILCVLNSVNGVCYALYEPQMKTILSLTENDQKRLLSFNLRYVAITIGSLIGPLVSAYFNPKESNVAYLWFGGTYLLIGIVNAIAVKNVIFDKQSIKKVKSKCQSKQKKSFRAFIFLIIGSSFSYFGYAQFQSTVSIYYVNSQLFKNGLENYSFTIATSALVVLVFQVVCLKWTFRRSSYYWLILSNSFFVLSLLLVVYSNYTIVWIGMIISYSLGELFLGLRLDYAVAELADQHETALYFSLTELVKLGSTIGPVVGAYLVLTCTYTQAFLLLGSITGVGTLFFICSYKQKKKT